MNIMEAIFKYGLDSLSKTQKKHIYSILAGDIEKPKPKRMERKRKTHPYHSTWGEIYGWEYDKLNCGEEILRGGKHKLSAKGQGELVSRVHKLTKVALGRDI